MARVARRVGLVPSAVYRHFESKDELLDAVLEMIRERLNANVVQASQDAADALQVLRRLGDGPCAADPGKRRDFEALFSRTRSKTGTPNERPGSTR